MTLWSLRPAGEHAGLRRAAQGAGLRLRALPQQRLAARADDASRRALEAALEAPIRVYTSPAAVRFAARLAGDGAGLVRPGIDVAVGAGTAGALRALGARDVHHPARMDSEGALALPALRVPAGTPVGLVTAPGGRGLLAATLRERDAALRVADVYERRPVRGGARARAALLADRSGVLLASSAESIALLLERLPGRASRSGLALRARGVVASSARLAGHLRAAGFATVVEAESARPEALVAAALAMRP